MNWWWKWKAKKQQREFEEARVTLASLAEVPLKWNKSGPYPPLNNEVGKCIFCHSSILRMEEYLELREIGTTTGWGDVYCCKRCAVLKGLEW